MLNLISRILNKAGRIAIAASKFAQNHSNSSDFSENIKIIDSLIYEAIPEIRPLPIKIESVELPKIILLLPSLTASGFYGGIATALIIGAKFALYSNRNLLIVQTVVSGYFDSEALDDFYRSKSIDVSNIRVSVLDIANRDGIHNDGRLSVNERDMFIASAWSDAFLIDKLNLSTKFLYLIQDYEPIFYANSDRSIMAENTYRYVNYIPLCNTKLMHLTMVHEGYQLFSKFPYWFEPAVSNIESGSVVKNTKKNIFLYGRPSVARNLFYTIVMALRHIFRNELLSASEWNIFMAGQDDLPTIELMNNCNIINLGKMNIDDYTKFAKSVDVAISLMMAPHPNYPTLEFASIGSAVVTTKYGVKDDLSFYSKNILTSELNLDSIIANIIKASEMSYELRINNIVDNRIGVSWNDALHGVIESVSKEFSQLNNNQ